MAEVYLTDPKVGVAREVDSTFGLCFSIIDEDPFAFVSGLAEHHTGISLARIHMKSPSPDFPDDICVAFVTAESQPNLSFFAPSTRNRVDALALYVQSKHPDIRLAEEVPIHWHEWLVPAISHSLREEGQFGSEFWR